MSAFESPALPSHSNVRMTIFAGFCASLVSIGLARFAYTPLIPPLIQAHWFAANDVVYLGAANLIGYLIGALLGHSLAYRLSNKGVLRLMMVVVTLSFFACGFPVSFVWFFVWRLLSGIGGGAVMVLVAATVLPYVRPSSRGLASGAIFLGIGLGIAGSGTIIPPLLTLGIQQTWFGLGIVSVILAAASWFGWPSEVHGSRSAEPSVSTSSAFPAPARNTGIYLLYAQYGLMAIGLVPAMMFLVDYVARGIGAGSHAGAIVWFMYGLGAIAGPVTYGFVADRLGGQTGIWLVLVAQAIVLVFMPFTTSVTILAFLAIVIGSFPPGIVPLTITRVHELTSSPSQQQIVWSRATATFATAQACAGFAYSALFDASGGHHAVLFLIACGAVVLALLLEQCKRLLSSALPAQ